MSKILALSSFFALLSLLSLCQAKETFDNCPPPYSNCNLGKEGYINVHIVPHTHDDVGWLKTVDQYYYGSNTDQQEASVQYILDTVVQELEKDPSKRFVYVEIAFFWRWWNEQNDNIKQLVRTLVNEGRLEFVIAAWCMNDEATTYYQDIIDQQTLGLKFVLKEFGSCARPRSAWQIDPFGHSREQGSLFAQFGFDGVFMGRIDYEDSDHRTETKTREMLWQASANLDSISGRIFTGILPYGYNPPPGFCFDTYCGDEPIMDDPNLDEYNVDKKVSDFLNYTRNQATQYKTSNLIMTMGSDFQYSNAHMWFKNLDKLIYYVNQESDKSKINIFYSTTACYLYSLNQANVSWPLKMDDFFPYAHRPHSFWTGYFTSRPALKNFVRRANNYLQVARQLSSFTDLSDEKTKQALGLLDRAMGVAQHHDAVSGTERQHVANDYAKRLSRGMNACLDVINNAIFTVSRHQFNFEYCHLMNISQCSVSENSNHFTIILYNPLSRDVSHWVRVPVVSEDYVVKEDNDQIVSENSPVYKETQLIPERESNAIYDLVFKAEVPALGFRLFTVDLESESAAHKNKKITNKKFKQRRGSPFNVQNENLKLDFDGMGNLVQVTNVQNQLTTQLSQTFCIYTSMAGDNSVPEKQASGAYIFRPQSQSPDCLQVNQFSVYKGEQFTEVHQVFNSWISQTIRLYDGEQNAEFEWQVGPIYADDKVGREVVTKFESDLESSSLFYTDANGREILQRKRDFRPTWDLNNTEPVSGNYYPINSRIFLRDEQEGVSKSKDSILRQLTLVTDRSQGGSSMQDGSLEIMVHRRTLFDDSLGVSEPINELGKDGKGLVVKGIVNLLFDSIENSARLHRDLAHRVNTQPLVLFSADQVNTNSSLRLLRKWQGIKGALPDNVHLLTVMKDFDEDDEILKSVIVRLEHFYEKDEDQVLSQPAVVDLLAVFGQAFNITNVQELALGANMKVEDLNQRLKWTAENDKVDKVKRKSKNFKNVFTFELNPMQIRTFRIWYLPME